MTRFITWSVRPENGLFMKSKLTARNLVDFIVNTYTTSKYITEKNGHVKSMPNLLFFLFLIKGNKSKTQRGVGG